MVLAATHRRKPSSKPRAPRRGWECTRSSSEQNARQCSAFKSQPLHFFPLIMKKELLTVVAALLPLSAAAQQRYNIVYIMTDDHTAQMLSAYDHRNIQTPNLDRVAQDGVKFTRSFVANSLSGPSRACMLTGKHSHKNGFTNNEHGIFNGAQQTMPKLLQKAGYQTALIGKWHLVSQPTGFDHWDILPAQGNYYNPDFLCNGKPLKRQGYVTNIIADLAIDWMENKRDPSKPFCLLMHNKAPHRVWNPDTCDLDLFNDVQYPLPETFYDNYEGRLAAQKQKMSIIKDMDIVYDNKMADHEQEIHSDKELEAWGRRNYERMTPSQKAQWDRHYDPIIQKFKADKLTGKALAEWKYQRYMHDYMRVIRSVDRNVGRVIEYLREKNLLDNTMIVYTSDQGFYMGEHGWFDKRFMYEESFRTPLLIYCPGGKQGVVNEMVQNIDYAPTFLEAAGVKVPSDIQGCSLLPLLQGKKPANWRKSLYYHYYEYPAEHSVCRHYGIRTKRYTLIHFYNDIDSWELYDLKKDPSQLHNIYGQKGTEKLTERLKKELKELQVQYNDPIRNQY